MPKVGQKFVAKGQHKNDRRFSRLFELAENNFICCCCSVRGLLFSRPEYKQTSEEERRKEIEPEA